MNKSSRVLFALVYGVIISASLSSCAYVSAKRIPFESTEKEGFPYYMKKPLLVVANENVKVIYIDDHTNLWGVKFGAVLAKNKTDLIFADGGLTNVTGDLDDQALALAFVDLAKSALTEAVKGGFLGGDVKSSSPTGKFQIFDIIYDDKTGAFKGLNPLISQEVFRDKMLAIPIIAPAVVAPAVVPAPGGAKKPDPNPPPAK